MKTGDPGQDPGEAELRVRLVLIHALHAEAEALLAAGRPEAAELKE